MALLYFTLLFYQPGSDFHMGKAEGIHVQSGHVPGFLFSFSETCDTLQVNEQLYFIWCKEKDHVSIEALPER